MLDEDAGLHKIPWWKRHHIIVFEKGQVQAFHFTFKKYAEDWMRELVNRSGTRYFSYTVGRLIRKGYVINAQANVGKQEC